MTDELSPYRWPERFDACVALTFDVDADVGFAWPGIAEKLTSRSEASYGAVRGLPRILETLRRRDPQATFYVPREIYEWPQHPYTLTLLASATTVSEATGGEAQRTDHLLALRRPYVGEQTTHRDCCPLANRCWQAREECLDSVPIARGERQAVRYVASLDEAARAAALGTAGTAALRPAG